MFNNMIKKYMKTIEFKNAFITSYSSVAGRLEGEGPLGELFDHVCRDSYFGKETWEQAESEMSRIAMNLALAKSYIGENGASLIVGGDLLDQCTATSFAALTFASPFLGLYGACSTAVESLITGSAFVENGYAPNCLCVASSHFCSSEKQFRFPLGYGAQRPPVTQNTVTGAGAFLVEPVSSGIRIRRATVGRVTACGVTDANNMGSAMAPAAVDTILRFFADTGELPSAYDVIATGDLGEEGLEIARELLARSGFDRSAVLADCGVLIYDAKKQDVHSGGSGCGCSAAVTAAYFLPKIAKKEIKRMLLVGTGALLSPRTVLQKLPIPATAHLIELECV